MYPSRLSFRGRHSTRMQTLVLFAITLMIVSVAHADEATDAKAVTSTFLKLTDQEDAEGVYRTAGEQLKKTAPKSETIAGLKRWFEVKGGVAISRELVMQRAYTEEQANAAFPTVKTKGRLYAFRYRSKYPKGIFFEDLYVSHDSDGVLRINGHIPQPAD